jgi:hypothetical protein
VPRVSGRVLARVSGRANRESQAVWARVSGRVSVSKRESQTVSARVSGRVDFWPVVTEKTTIAGSADFSICRVARVSSRVTRVSGRVAVTISPAFDRPDLRGRWDVLNGKKFAVDASRKAIAANPATRDEILESLSQVAFKVP